MGAMVLYYVDYIAPELNKIKVLKKCVLTVTQAQHNKYDQIIKLINS